MNSYNEVREALSPAIGVPFRELASALGIALPKEAKSRKSAGGDITEKLLEIAKNSIPKPDLILLGTEVKTVSLNTLSRPREWIKITRFNLEETKGQPDFRRSSLFGKLRSILFVPIMKVDNAKPDFWYLRPPFLWLPSEDQLIALEKDYNKIQASAAEENWAQLGGRPGTFLTLNTSDSKTKGKAPEKKGRAWWLTKQLTDGICELNLWPKAAVEARLREVAAPNKSAM